MAITSFDISCDNKMSTTSSVSANSSKRSSGRLLKSKCTTDCSLSSGTSKCKKSNNKTSRSPYLAGDRVQLFSRVVEKRFVHKTDILSSFPLAANLYKASCDDLKSVTKATKKVKKSVLTLPNDPAPVPQVYTVSDMNDSEYQDNIDEDRKRKVIKKRTPIQNNRKARVREKNFEFYDRDAKYCSQLNINLDCSSTDMMTNFNGDGKRMSNRKKKMPASNKTPSSNLSDVWAVLRNMNRFQFRPSPPMSEESNVPEKKVQKRSNKTNRKDTRVIKTCRTQEFAYISSYELDKKSPHNSFSPSSSIDRITVIDNEDNFTKICEEFEKRLLGTRDFNKDTNNTKTIIHKNKTQNKIPRSNVRTFSNVGPKDKPLVPSKKKKKINLQHPAVEQSKSELTTSSENKDSLIYVESLKLNDNSDILSDKAKVEDTFLSEGNLGRCFNSGPNKDELSFTEKEQASRNDKPSDVEALNKELESITTKIPKRLDPPQRKPRLVTTMPSSNLIPKLTTADIRRRLANIRFPIVVLGKDQVSSSIEIMDYDPPQFHGLDDHIWPFMNEWSPNAPEDTKYNTLSKNCQPYLLDVNSTNQIKSKSRKQNTEISTYKAPAWKEKKQTNNDSNKKKAKITLTPNSEITDKLLQCSKKQKSILQLKDKMLNFLCKTSSKNNVYNDSYVSEECVRSLSPILNDNSTKIPNENKSKISSITDIQMKPVNVLVLNNLAMKGARIVGSNSKPPTYKYPWAKAKWASDFIENVINKIRNGVYYTQDRKDICHTYEVEFKEASVQAESIRHSAYSTQTCDREALTYDGTDNINKNNHISIPGFNNTPPLLEIKTLNMNQISVKHCVTNVMVQFDVTVPAKCDQSATSLIKTSTFTPIAITDSYTKVYKSKTTIFNAMLPAELCSILPIIMRNIIDSSKSLAGDSAPCPEKSESWLSTITELTRFENGESLSKTTSSLTYTPTEIDHILQGMFSNIYYKKPTSHKINFKIEYNHGLVLEMLPMAFLKYEASPLVKEIDNSQYIHSQISLHQSNNLCETTEIQNHTICTSAEIYTGSNKILTSAFKPNNLIGFIESMMRKYNLQINYNLSTYLDMLQMQYDGKTIEINMLMTNNDGFQKEMSVTVSNLNIDSLCEALPKTKINETNMLNRNNNLKCIEYISTSLVSQSKNMELTQVVTLNKTNKRKGFCRLYRKYKSNNIPSRQKCISTPLNKIVTLDDFYQILGPKKIFSSVLDGSVANKILPSLMEMKNWISEINPKQALLILLLTNKKDTQNLVRFRPLILQGIAVSRITRATELDMEIEVIDRENLNKQFEGITYLPESDKNYENLLEELYWIAKTTAADHKKPFDETSERLLKSLLQKRKRLNPSYLRVMARYVGLGLVKKAT